MKNYSESTPSYAAPDSTDCEDQIETLIGRAEIRLRQQRREMAASRFLVGLGLILAAKAMSRGPKIAR